LGKTTTLPLREFAAIGILGGFTTFSTFGLESFEMLQAGQF
jgi:CrcB protein